jgi:hypothetical protein
MNEREDKHVFISDLIDESIGLHQQFSNGLVAKFRDGLSTLCEIRQGLGSVSNFLDKGGGIELGVTCDVVGRNLQVVPRGAQSRLLFEPSGHPLHDLFVWDDVALLNCFKASLHFLTDVNVILNVVQ